MTKTASKIILVILFVFLALFLSRAVKPSTKNASSVINAPTLTPMPTPTPTLTPIPTPILLDPTVYGPCKNIPVLLYHHVQPQEQAVSKGQQNISVDAGTFEKQMQYLIASGYNTLTPQEFLGGLQIGLPPKPVMLTFDDGYDDFYLFAFPILQKYNLRATAFIATGLVENPGYLNWGQISQMRGSGLVTFADHTWSHKNLGGAPEQVIRQEISTAKTQLEEHGLGPVEFFAYPYGSKSGTVDKVLLELGFKAAFTTIPGWQQCAGAPFSLRRDRVGGGQLSFYGL